MTYKNLQNQYDKIYSFFKTTTDYFDYLDWNGKLLYIWRNGEIIEKYSLKILKKLKCI